MMRRFDFMREQSRYSPLFFISIICFFIFCLTTNVHAESNKVSFDAEAVLPENQQSDASYYDLQVKPDEKQNLILKVRNTSSNQIKVIVEANNALTNKNGAIDYSNHGEKLLGGPSFEDLISESQTVMLAPEEEKSVVFHLAIPKQGFDGTILGGFYCYEDTENKHKKNEGFSLRNKFAYTLGAKLTCTDKEIEPKFSLDEVTPGLENGYLTIFATLANAAPVIKSQLDVHAIVTKKGEEKPIKEFQKKVSFTPRTKFKLPLSWNNEPLKKGTYELAMDLKDGDGKKWHLKKIFEIKGTDEKLNHQAVKVNDKDEPNLLMYCLFGFTVVIILSLIWYINKLRRQLK